MPSGEERRRKEREDLILGRHPVREALRAGRPLQRLLLAQGVRGNFLAEFKELARKQGIPVQEWERAALDRLTGGAAHQGVVAVAAGHRYAKVAELLAAARARGEDPFLVVLDGVEDPHNLGSVLRTAEAAGAHGVVIPRHRAVGLTPAVLKVAAGAAEYVPVARVTNLAQTLEELKEAGLWVVGGDQEGKELWTQVDLTGPLALVIGGEGKGLRRLVRERCDRLVRLPMQGRINSLNAGVAAGILLYEALRQRMLSSLRPFP